MSWQTRLYQEPADSRVTPLPRVRSASSCWERTWVKIMQDMLLFWASDSVAGIHLGCWGICSQHGSQMINTSSKTVRGRMNDQILILTFLNSACHLTPWFTTTWGGFQSSWRTPSCRCSAGCHQSFSTVSRILLLSWARCSMRWQPNLGIYDMSISCHERWLCVAYLKRKVTWLVDLHLW